MFEHQQQNDLNNYLNNTNKEKKKKKKKNRRTRSMLRITTLAACLLLLIQCSCISTVDAKKKGREKPEESKYVIYANDFIDDAWRDYSWNERLVDFQSSPGFESSSAVDADIEGWGAFALARIQDKPLECDSDDNAGNDECKDKPSFVAASDAKAKQLRMRIQGPKGSSTTLQTREVDNDGSETSWLFLTDGRVIPKLELDDENATSEEDLAIRGLEKYTRPTSLNDIALKLEHSRTGKSSKEVLLSSLLPSEESRRMRGSLVDDSRWIPIKVELSPLLEASDMATWDKVVLKDAKGNGFKVRLDDIYLTGDDFDGKGGKTKEVEVATKTQKVETPNNKAIHSWLDVKPTFVEEGDANLSTDPEVLHTNALEEFTSAQLCKTYDSPVNVANILDGELKEPSGLAASRRYKGILWTHQDRDTDPYLYAVIAKTGQVVSKLHVGIQHYSETDWEDISVSLCPDGSGDHCLWIADSGNVRRDREVFFVHVFREPKLQRYGEIEPWDIWTFSYQFPLDRQRKRPWIDIESLLVAPDGSKFWLVEKTVNHNGDGPVTIWETPEWKSPQKLVAMDKNNTLMDVTQRGRGAVYDHPNMLIEMALVNKIINPKIAQIASYLKPEAFDPPLADWAVRKYKKEDMNWNKLRAITGVDIHPTGKSLIACTYSGIWEFPLKRPFDLRSESMGQPKLLSITSRYDDSYWQTEAITYDSDGAGIWLASEYFKGHQPLRFIGCRKDKANGHLE